MLSENPAEINFADIALLCKHGISQIRLLIVTFQILYRRHNHAAGGVLRGQAIKYVVKNTHYFCAVSSEQRQRLNLFKITEICRSILEGKSDNRVAQRIGAGKIDNGKVSRFVAGNGIGLPLRKKNRMMFVRYNFSVFMCVSNLTVIAK